MYNPKDKYRASIIIAIEMLFVIKCCGIAKKTLIEAFKF